MTSFSIKQQILPTGVSSSILTSEGISLSEQIESIKSNIQKTENGQYLYHPHEDVKIDKKPVVKTYIPKLEERLFTKPLYDKEEIIYDNIQEKWIVTRKQNYTEK
jgi:hypothetical protein